MQKITLTIIALVFIAACSSTGPETNEARIIDSPPPAVDRREPIPGTRRPIQNGAESKDGSKIEVIPYDPNSEILPDPVAAELDVVPYDPNAFQPGPFADLNTNKGDDDPAESNPVIEIGGGPEEHTNPGSSEPSERIGSDPEEINLPPNAESPGTSESPDDSLASAQLQELIVELERRRDSEEGNTVANAKALLALYLASGVSANIDFADKASGLINHLRERQDFKDAEWLRLQSAEFDRQVSDAEKCARQLQEAYLSALRLVEMDVDTPYFCKAGDKPQTETFFEKRMTTLPNGELAENNAVRAGDIFYIAFKFRYMNFSEAKDDGYYGYRLKIVPSFTDKEGNPVKGFKGDVFEGEFDWRAPDRWGPGRQTYTLPFNIPEGTYTLSMTFYDMNRAEPEKHPVTKILSVIVR